MDYPNGTRKGSLNFTLKDKHSSLFYPIVSDKEKKVLYFLFLAWEVISATGVERKTTGRKNALPIRTHSVGKCLNREHLLKGKAQYS
jgi:hypothetical protein